MVAVSFAEVTENRCRCSLNTAVVTEQVTAEGTSFAVAVRGRVTGQEPLAASCTRVCGKQWEAGQRSHEEGARSR